jgi:hypothetical protein
VELADLLQHVVSALERVKIPYAIVGSYASSIWGESRLTQDIDIVIQADERAVESLCQAFPEPEFYVSRAAAIDAVKYARQFNVIHPASGHKIDFMVAGKSDWTNAQLTRCKQVQITPNLVSAVASPEDVILGKLIYYREGGSDKHLRDIAGILRISGDAVDRNYISQVAAQQGVVDAWQAALSRLRSP